MDAEETAREPADVAKTRAEWEARARSRYRNFYVASHFGFDRPEAWERQARADVQALLHRLEWDREGCIGETPFHEVEALEIGCGVGRLAVQLEPKLKSYTGFDIAPTMVEAARAGSPRSCRFFVGSGDAIPQAARDRAYQLVIAWAVFIHCNLRVCAAMVRAAREVLAPGGQIRCQLLGDPKDPSGYLAPPASDVAVEDAATGARGEPHAPGTTKPRRHELEGAVAEEALALIENTDYKGHEFGFEEARALFVDAGFVDPIVLRFDPAHVYVCARR